MRLWYQAISQKSEACSQSVRHFVSMFQMTKEDIEEWKSQIVISNSIKMGLLTKFQTLCEHNLRRDEEHWKVVLTEEEFQKRMFEE